MTQVEELEIVAKYLDQDSLEQIAKKAAYDLFSNLISHKENKYSRENLDYFITKGAMLAMAEEIDPIRKELQNAFNKRVLNAINKLDTYDITKEEYGFTKILKETIEENRSKIIDKIEKTLSTLVNDDTQWDSIYSRVNNSIGDIFANVISSLIESKYKNEQ